MNRERLGARFSIVVAAEGAKPVGGKVSLIMDLDAVRDSTSIGSGESPGLDPGVWKMLVAGLAKEKQTAIRRYTQTLLG